MNEQLGLPLTGSLVIRGQCPACKGNSIQIFKSQKVIYFLCQYCLHKWYKKIKGKESGFSVLDKSKK
ncbi:hypothetical protein Desru_0645 [Desulforamulus ruminis DSM 2154]|uniref:Uncharacterized protein n=1 Tax=Desulforamulus ruminis (strain ATCC 23193 / DSM 2154 / NCIMB 8452 / DL) TaxID=696281 RepID=F6DTB3_DESRL|nr:hypothetical protein Desru_0645 [Desulforamulus ruminis DSM 2154]